MRKSTCAPRRESGMMLIEALVAILIFSIGILALVGLQATAVKQSTDARFRSDAAALTNDIIAEMWVSDRTTATLNANFAGSAGSGGLTTMHGQHEWEPCCPAPPAPMPRPLPLTQTGLPFPGEYS